MTKQRHGTYTFGVIGGICSGKTTVTDMFVQRGAGYINADELGHAVLRFPDVRECLVTQLGHGILGNDEEIDRLKLARLVFLPTEKSLAAKRFLESVTHPRIAELVKTELSYIRAAGLPLAILDAPLLLEGDWQELCDKIVFVDCAPDTRQARAIARGWTADQWRSREAAQFPLSDKRRAADFIIENNGDIAATEIQVENTWQQILADA